MNWLRRLFAGKRMETDLDKELRFHFESQIADKVRSGISEREARRLTRLEFGGIEQIIEDCRESRGTLWLESIVQDVRFALRQLRRSPGYTAVCLLTLCLGIGANTAVFSVIEAVILQPLPYRDPNSLMRLTDPQDPQDGGILYKDFEWLKRQSGSFEDVAAYYRDSGWSRVTLTGTQEPQAVQGAFVSADFFSLLGEPPILGRVFTSEEESRHEQVVLLSFGLWQRRFGKSPDVVGQSLQIDGGASRIIGVMPETFQLPAADSQFWAPITTNHYWGDPAANSDDGHHARGFYARWQAMGRLKQKTSPLQAQAELDIIFHRLEKADPDPDRGIGIKGVPVRVEVNGSTRLALYVLFTSVCLLLLITCSNVANLLLARGLSRARELAVRTALGASRGRILQQSVTETVLLAGLSGLLSLPVAYLGIRALINLGPGNIPRLQETGLNLSILGFTFGIVLLCSVVMGLAPAIRNWGMEPAQEVNSRTVAASNSGGLTRLRSALIVAEVALSVVLLTGAGLLIHSFLVVKAVDPRFEPEHVLTVNVSFPGASSGWPSSLFDSIVGRLQGIPGVQDIGAIDSLFDLGPTDNLGLRSVEGRPSEQRKQWTALTWDTVRGDYFQSIGAQLLRGRYFSDEDGLHSPLVAVIDESAARRFWPGEDAVGKRFKGQDHRGQNDEWLTVIGVVRDIRTHGLERQPTAHIYEWYRQSGNATPDLTIRATGNPAELAATVRNSIWSVAPAAILSGVSTVDEQLYRQLVPRRFQTFLLGLFSLLALLIASIGIYGLINFNVAQRTREIGIRMALGARRNTIVAMVIRQGLVLVSIGLGLGLCLDWFATRLLTGLLYGVKPSDPLTLLCVLLLLLSVTIVASSLPASKAASVDPMDALRAE